MRPATAQSLPAATSGMRRCPSPSSASNSATAGPYAFASNGKLYFRRAWLYDADRRASTAMRRKEARENQPAAERDADHHPGVAIVVRSPIGGGAHLMLQLVEILAEPVALVLNVPYDLL